MPAAEGTEGSAAARGRRAVPGAGMRTHAAVALLLALLTAGAFVLAARSGLRYRALAPLVLALAGVQVTLQVLFYMHLRAGDRLIALFFVGAAALAVFIAWVVWYLLVLR